VTIFLHATTTLLTAHARLKIRRKLKDDVAHLDLKPKLRGPDNKQIPPERPLPLLSRLSCGGLLSLYRRMT